MRWQFGLGLVWALALVFAGSAGLVGAVWVMSRGGGRLYDLLIAR